MNDAANVRSLDAVRDFRVAIAKFREQAAHALAAVDIEIARTLDWLGHDQLKYWKAEIRRREDRVNEAKMDLHRAQLCKNAAGETPACTDQKVALAKAKARLGEAEEKLEKVRQWLQIIEHEVTEYKGPAQQLANTVDTSLPRALALIDRKLVSLEEYLNTAAPEIAALARAGDPGPEIAVSSAPSDSPGAKIPQDDNSAVPASRIPNPESRL
ncbi:MAG TPA: hypothetical protein VG713_11765 [Pirellulales bacterium]|nr:hypothetical protein [Pirellulales bacterium]